MNALIVKGLQFILEHFNVCTIQYKVRAECLSQGPLQPCEEFQYFYLIIRVLNFSAEHILPSG